MGYWKDVQERIDSGVYEHEDDYVCADCFDDDGLKNFVKADAKNKDCTFCGAQGDHPIAAPFLNVIEHMSNCLAREYDIAENCLPYEGAEGGFQGTVWTTYEFLTDQLQLDLPNDGDNRLLGAIENALGERSWCDAHPFLLSDSDDRLRVSWEEFCNVIKHQRRFFFMEEPRDPHDELLGPGAILDAIGRWCRKFHLIADLHTGTKVFRARYQNSGPRLVTPGRPKPRNATTPCWSSQPWRRDSNKMASAKPGAVHRRFLSPS